MYADQELLSVIPQDTSIKCAMIKLRFHTKYRGMNNFFLREDIVLPIVHERSEYFRFLSKLMLSYDNVWRGESLISGTVWLKNGGWLSRNKIDGVECWVYNRCPDLPEELKKK